MLKTWCIATVNYLLCLSWRRIVNQESESEQGDMFFWENLIHWSVMYFYDLECCLLCMSNDTSIDKYLNEAIFRFLFRCIVTVNCLCAGTLQQCKERLPGVLWSNQVQKRTHGSLSLITYPLLAKVIFYTEEILCKGGTFKIWRCWCVYKKPLRFSVVPGHHKVALLPRIE